MKNATELFGARIRELRKAQGLTQEQLADFLGIEQKHVSLIELGKSYPSLDRLMRIAEVLKVPLPSLFDFAHHAPEALSPETMVKRIDGMSDHDRQLLYRMAEFMEEMKG
jgi:transcriptional regulator with XRE-family HTH domain